MASLVNDPPSPGSSDGLNGTTPVDDPSTTRKTPFDLSSNSHTPGHQGVKTAGGSNPNLRVLECSQMCRSYDYEMIYDKLSTYGEIQRIKMILTRNETAFDCYITFASSLSAFSAYDHLRENDADLCKKFKIISVSNLEDDMFDFVPPSFIPEEERVERVLPIPTWHVAFYKEGKDNMIRAAESIQKKVGNIPRGNLKRYGRNLLIKAGNKTQAALLSNFKPSSEGNIRAISPHRSFNTLKGVVYSKDLYEYSEWEILEKCPPHVYKVKKLKGDNNAIMLTFTSSYLPDCITFDHTRIKVKKFHQRPTQCFKCFEYGHGYDKCPNPRKCSKCSGEHDDVENCPNSKHCFLCEGNHSPKSSDCPRFRFEQEILEVANNQHISIGSAKQIVMGANKSPDSSYAVVVKAMKLKSLRPDQKKQPSTVSAEPSSVSTEPTTDTPQPISAASLQPPPTVSPVPSVSRTVEMRPVPIPGTHHGGAKPRPPKSSEPKKKDHSEHKKKDHPSKAAKSNEKEKDQKARPSSNLEGSSKKSSREESDSDGPAPSKRIKSYNSAENVSEKLEVSNSFAVLESLDQESNLSVGKVPKPQRTRSVESIPSLISEVAMKESNAISLSLQRRPSLSKPSPAPGSRVKKLEFNNFQQCESPHKAQATGNN